MKTIIELLLFLYFRFEKNSANKKHLNNEKTNNAQLKQNIYTSI